MIRKKFKRFRVILRNEIRKIFSDEYFTKEDSIKATSGLVDYFMDIDIEYRLRMLKSLEKAVESQTSAEIVTLEQQIEKIKKELSIYKQ